LRLLDGAADRTDRNRFELLEGVAEATGRSSPVSCHFVRKQQWVRQLSGGIEVWPDCDAPAI